MEVKCRAQRGDIVTIGLNDSWSRRLTVKKKVGENAEEAAIRKLSSSIGQPESQQLADVETLHPHFEDDEARTTAASLFGSSTVFLNDVEDAVAERRASKMPERFSPEANIRDQRETAGKRKQLWGVAGVETALERPQPCASRIDESDLQLPSNESLCSKPECMRLRAKGGQLKRKLGQMQDSLSMLRDNLDRTCDGLEAWEVTSSPQYNTSNMRF